MGTYHNGHSILADVREAVNENEAGRLEGTDTSGKYQNSYLMKSINRAQRVMYSRLFIRNRNMFLTSAPLTGVDSVFTLPWDFGEIRRFEDTNQSKVYPLNIDHKPRIGSHGSDKRYYRQGRTLVLTKPGSTQTYTLWYYSKPRELHQGLSAGIDTLAATASAVDDYYNNLTLENATDGTIHTVVDYTGASKVVALNTGSLASGKYYGTVSGIPEPFHHLIAPLGAMLAKADHPVAPEKPARASVEFWRGEFDDAVLAFAGRPMDVREEDIWTDHDTAAPLGVEIPGQGYPIF